MTEFPMIDRGTLAEFADDGDAMLRILRPLRSATQRFVERWEERTALLRSSFGFTREDVVGLRVLAEDGVDGYDLCVSLAARIEALLPPE